MAAAVGTLVQSKARVVGALLMREMRTRFGRTPVGFWWAVAEPLALVAGMSYMFIVMQRPAPYGSSMPLFFATGMLPYYLFRRILSSLLTVLDRNEALFGAPGIAPVDAFAARTLMEVITYAAVMILTFGGMVVVLGVVEPDRIYVMGVAVLLLTLLGFGFGITSCLVAQFVPVYGKTMGLLNRALMFFSSIFMPLESTPTFLRDWIVWNPVAHGVELFRTGYYMGYRCSQLDVGYLFAFGLTLTMLGLVAERSLRMRGE